MGWARRWASCWRAATTSARWRTRWRRSCRCSSTVRRHPPTTLLWTCTRWRGTHARAWPAGGRRLLLDLPHVRVLVVGAHAVQVVLGLALGRVVAREHDPVAAV